MTPTFIAAAPRARAGFAAPLRQRSCTAGALTLAIAGLMGLAGASMPDMAAFRSSTAS